MAAVKDRPAHMLKGRSIDDYMALVRAFPLVSIRDRAHLDAAVAVIDSLIDKTERTAAEDAYLGALTDLVEVYEDEHVAVPPQTGLGMLQSLMEDNGLKQEDLAPILGTQSIVSEVLRGKRLLSKKYIEKLAKYFHVSPVVFFDEAS